MNNLSLLKYKGHVIDDTSKCSYIDMVDISGKGDIVPVIRYKALSSYKDIIHGFSTRLGGVSRDHLASMNLSFSRGDVEENVLENHRRFAKAVGYNSERLVFSDQVHDVKIHMVKEEDAGKGIIKESDIINIDGLVTNVKNIPLITFYADCVPLFFYDNINKVVGLAHSGWKGTVGNIANEMIKTMKNEYACMPENIVVAIGPSICMDCYEISEDVAVQFMDKYSDSELKYMLLNKGNGKYQLDLHQACKYNFLRAGILEDNISMPDFCTCCNPNELFSHRASNGLRGNLAAVIMLKE